jgi:hypothetical protein
MKHGVQSKMARRRADAPPRNDFELAMSVKDIDAKYLSERWGKEVRRINQIRDKPSTLHIDAISGIPKRRKRSPIYIPPEDTIYRNEFEQIMFEKAIDSAFLAERWEFEIRRINQIRCAPEVMHIDAIKGIPLYRKRINVEGTSS